MPPLLRVSASPREQELSNDRPRPQRRGESLLVLIEIAQHLGITQQRLDPVSLGEAFVVAEFELGRELQAQPLRDNTTMQAMKGRLSPKA